MTKKCILFFIQYPQPGRVKPRLIPDLGEEGAAELYKLFVEDLFATLKQLGHTIIVCYDPKEKGVDMLKWLGVGPIYYAQEGVDIGARLENAFYYAYSKGFSDVMVVGPDAPDLSKEVFEGAFERLNSTEVVIGPASDGGYYLLAFNRSGFFMDVFNNIPWMTEMVYMETWSKIRSAGKMCEVLPEVSDANNFIDLEMFYRRNQNTWFKDSKTMQWIRSKGLFKSSF